MMTRNVSAGVKVIRPIVAARVINPETGQKEEVYALVDTGADRDYLSTRVRDRLGLVKRESVINLKTVSESSIGVREISDIILESMDGSYKASVQDIMVGKFPDSDSDVIPAKEDWSGMKHLEDKIFVDIEARVEMIISSAHAEGYAPSQEPVTGERGQPVAIKSAFGWRLEGQNGPKKGGRRGASISLLSVEDRQLRDNIERIFNYDHPEAKYDQKHLSREAK